MPRTSRALALALSLLAPAAARPLAAQAPTRLEQVMSPEERARTGVARLAPAERAALEAWLARYTATVAAAARTVPGGSAPGAAALAAEAAPAPPPAPAEAPRVRAVRGALEIADVLDGGTFVRLADGTMWEVYLPHRPYSVAWKRGDWVLVRRPSAPVEGFDRALVNGGARSTASVRFAGVVRPRAAPAPR